MGKQHVRTAYRLLGCVSEHLFRGPAPYHHGAVRTQTDNRHRRCIDHGRQHFIRFALGCLQLLLRRHVAADEEVLLLRLGPHPRPVQSHRAAVLADVPRIKIADLASATCQPHFVARGFEIFGMNEFDPEMSDHLLRIVAENRPGTRTDVDEQAAPVRDQEQVERSLDDAAVQFAPMLQCAPFVRPMAEIGRASCRERV